ncbi:MAG TPA: DNA mismatch repair protein MutS, partial [Herpetosiphonaceae bacterium]|nr:DNA mismatch repair protein MutS [Herpetosiphonaceae bacterium]
ELGRGTSTYDGLAIAYAVLEYLHQEPTVAARTLFATHFHELTKLADRHERVRNAHLAVAEAGEQMVFLRRIAPGPAERSFGIHVAALAGLAQRVVDRAAQVLAALERRGAREQQRQALAQLDGEPATDRARMARGSGGDEVGEALDALDLDELTPLAALQALQTLKALRQIQRAAGGS